jgi:hypothetical protein
MSPRRTLQQDKLSTAGPFERFHHILRRRVRGVVNTSDASIEDACMHAWTKVLGYEFEHVDIAQRWLTTVAIREAIKLDRRSRRTAPFGVDEHGDTIEPADPRGELWLTRLLTDVGELMKTAGLVRGESWCCSCSASATTRSRLRPATHPEPSSVSSCAPAASSLRSCARTGGESRGWESSRGHDACALPGSGGRVRWAPLVTACRPSSRPAR